MFEMCTSKKEGFAMKNNGCVKAIDVLLKQNKTKSMHNVCLPAYNTEFDGSIIYIQLYVYRDLFNHGFINAIVCMWA